MPQPLVSIIIPVYNAEKYIEETINSAINQTWPNKEIIIVDDGSKDASLLTAQKFSSNNIKIISQKNQGASVARNTGLNQAKGEYIQFLDADDILTPDKIEGQMLALNGSKTHLALCKTIHFFDGNHHMEGLVANEWYKQDYDDPVDFLLKLYSGNEILPGYGGMIQPNSWLTPMNLIKKAGMWNEFRCPDDDGEFFCRVLLASDGIKYSDQGINCYRKFKTANSLSGQKSLAAYRNLILSLDLKYKYLRERTSDNLLNRIFARLYSEIGIATYPKYKAVSDEVLKKAKALANDPPVYKAGKMSMFLSKLFGWRIVRILTYYRYGF